jgi:hypothetical protein
MANLLSPNLYGLEDVVVLDADWSTDYDSNIDILETYSPQYFVAEAGEALSAGDCVCVGYDVDSNNSAKIYKALEGTEPYWFSGTASRQPAVGFVEKNYAITESARVRCVGVIYCSTWTLTAGSKYYLSSVTPGGISTTLNNHLVGVALSATNLLIRNKMSKNVLSVNLYCGSGAHCGEGYWSGA